MESNHLPLPYAKTAHSLMCFSGHMSEQDPAHHGRRDPYSVVTGSGRKKVKETTEDPWDAVYSATRLKGLQRIAPLQDLSSRSRLRSMCFHKPIFTASSRMDSKLVPLTSAMLSRRRTMSPPFSRGMLTV